MSNTASLKKEYQDRIVPALTKEFGYKTVMQVPVLKKIVINQGLGMALALRFESGTRKGCAASVRQQSRQRLRNSG